MYHVCDPSDTETQFKCPKCDYVHDRRQFMRHHKVRIFWDGYKNIMKSTKKNWSKNMNAKIWQISGQESKKWSNHKIKALYNVFNTLNSPYNHM